MNNFKDKTVLITGGASGIGFLMSQMLIQKGIGKLIILDINQKGLEETKNQLGSHNCDLHLVKVDISKEEELDKSIAGLKGKNLAPDILINNAGVVTGKTFIDHSYEDIDLTMQVNSIAPMKLSLAFLPDMIKKTESCIVNISSAAGMLPNPDMSVYCASKWAMNGWSDSLRLEMEKARTGVNVLTVTPYYISTGMFEGVSSPIIPILKPEKVAKKIIKAIEKKRIVLRMPGIIYLLPLVKGILPKRWLDIVIGKFFGIYSSMNKFKGRTNE